MNSIDLPTLMTTIFVLVDDWYQHKMQPWLRLHPGPRASFSDSYDLVPANTDERQAAEGVLQCVRGSDIYADQGFISAEWQAAIALNTGNRLWTVKRTNQHQQHSPEINRFISRVRQRIEGVFHEIQNTLSKPRTSPQ